MAFCARTKEGYLPEEWQLLSDHLGQVSERAAAFAAPFGGQELAQAIGLAHDAGKISQAFQQRLFGAKKRVDHSTAGGQVVNGRYALLGRLLAYCIMGHHSAMPNAGSVNEPGSLVDRLAWVVPDYSAFSGEVALPEKLDLPWRADQLPGFSYSFLARTLFSCLVDADRLDAEAFREVDKTLKRGSFPSLPELAERMEKHMEEVTATAEDTLVNRERAYVLQCCREAAKQPSGLFTLTVPTGGGKTLASLDFALRHALRHGLKRVIYVIPFTSIIGQTARVFRKALGDEVVLEHHSNYSFDRDDDDSSVRLATENWDAPVIVTTNVQFFESLFSNKPSQCRKLHNIAESVIVFDEAQTIPDELLRPCLAALEELVLHYRVSAVLCTATQPALAGLWPMGSQPREIIPDPERLFASLKRVTVEYRGKMSDQEVTAALFEEQQSLCIVNTRRHAADLFALLGVAEGHYHLSARMCPAHREQQIEEIKQRLRKGKKCRAISTQLIEAGVDVDFPLVYRAVAGIDSIAQAAGRCNREGKQNMGATYVFEPELGVPRGWFRRMAELGRRVMEEVVDPLEPEAIKRFFIRRFDLAGSGLDKHEILQTLEFEWRALKFPFKDIAETFRMIDDFSQSIVIPYDEEAQCLLNQAEVAEHPGIHQRQLQRYTIGIHPMEFADYLQRGWLHPVRDIYYVLDHMQGYDQHVGLRTVDDALQESLMV